MRVLSFLQQRSCAVPYALTKYEQVECASRPCCPNDYAIAYQFQNAISVGEKAGRRNRQRVGVREPGRKKKR